MHIFAAVTFLNYIVKIKQLYHFCTNKRANLMQKKKREND